MKIIYLTFVLFCISALSAEVQTQCNQQENILFSCETGLKTISVCLNKQKVFSYRFGIIGNPELTFENTHPTGNTLMYSGGGGAYLRMSNQNYDYIVYTGTGKGWIKSGISIEKNGVLIKNLECKKLTFFEIGADFFEKYKLKSGRGFNIP